MSTTPGTTSQGQVSVLLISRPMIENDEKVREFLTIILNYSPTIIKSLPR